MLENTTNINKNNIQKSVLLAPLDWGLGHATRCIPIISDLINNEFKVILAAEKAAAILLQQAFPLIKIIPLEGYKILYSKTKKGFLWKMMLQFPKILKAIKNENRWLKNVIKEYKIDIVISDNRFGLYNKNAHCIFITHQLTIKIGNALTEYLAQKINYKYINKFNECWVIDEDEKNDLGGELSHPKKKPNTVVKYIGTLSRFKKYEVEKKYDLLVLLSGPEPQRTIFENILIAQMQALELNIALVRGLPEKVNLLEVDNLKIYNHMPAAELNELVLASKIVIARSGYTTVMDLAALQQKAIYVPTPGQTEQEYLAKYLSEKKYCITEMQDGFNLKNALHKIDDSNLILYPSIENVLLQKAINPLK